MKKKTLVSVNTIPPDIFEIFGPPPILSSEDERIYYPMVERFAKDIAPSDFIAWLLIKDLVDYRLEIARYRRMTVAIMMDGQERWRKSKLADEIIKHQIGLEEMTNQKEIELRRAENIWPHDDSKISEQKAKVEAHFQEKAAFRQLMLNSACRPLSADPKEADFAIAIPYWVEDHDKVNQLLENTERKFLGTLRELDRHIFGFSKALREDLKIIEGEVLGRTQHRPGYEERGTKRIEASGPQNDRLAGSLESQAERNLNHDFARSSSGKPGKRTEKHRPTDRSGQAELKP